jgi:hypothetical protein
MKRIALLYIGIFCAEFGMEQKKESPAPLVEHKFRSADVVDGIAAYNDFKQHVPAYKLDPVQLRGIFPRIFEYVPAELHQALADYVAYKYPDSNTLISELSRLLYSEFGLRLLKWKALGYAFELMPYYSFDQGYFYFEQPKVKDENAVLKGVREDNSVKALADLDDLIKKLAVSRDQMKEAFIKQANSEWQEVADSMVQEYKIHLMPQGDPTQTIVMLLTLLKKDPELQNLIAAFKVMAVDKLAVNGVYFPRIVVYPARGKENAQKALNKLYVGLKDIKGLGIRPRYNAKVNDLIWVAQGDSNYKNQARYQKYFEKPEFRYLSPDLTGKVVNYHLVHPETGKEIV